MASLDRYSTPITRFYLDIRSLIPSNKHDQTHLPLIDTLLQEQRTAIQKYLRPADRLMSLASALLKYTFIHRYALIPWNEVRISKTLKPHNRPYWQPTTGWTGQGGLEFNITHQNGVVAIIGCKTPTPQDNHHVTPITKGTNQCADGLLTSERSTNQIRLGVDLACTHEEGRTPKDVTSQAKLDEWVDLFGEMFSWRCRQEIKHGEIPNTGSATIYQKRLRRFYAYWGLKEAFIKMVGEGLLADWLKELEFEGVHAPEPASPEDFPDDGFSWALSDDEERKWSAPGRAVRDIKATLYGKRVDDVSLEIVAYDQEFLVASSMQGVTDTNQDSGARWIKLEIEKDIRPCAEGRCQCLEQKIVSLSTTSVMTGEQEEYRIIQANGTKQEGFEVPYR